MPKVVTFVVVCGTGFVWKQKSFNEDNYQHILVETQM